MTLRTTVPRRAGFVAGRAILLGERMKTRGKNLRVLVLVSLHDRAGCVDAMTRRAIG